MSRKQPNPYPPEGIKKPEPSPAPPGKNKKSLQWTTKQPTEPGWYWICANQCTYCVRIDIRESGWEIDFLVRGYDCDAEFYDWDVTHFMGPIDEPKPPKKKDI